MVSGPQDHVVLYASDHGFGHAARMLALASSLAEEGYRATLCVGAARPMVEQAQTVLKKPVDVASASLDPGLIAKKGTLDFDMDASKEALFEWLGRLPVLVEAEAERLSSLRATLVIADAPAAALLAAKRFGAPAVVCSNFTWLDMYAGRFGEAMAQALHDAYRCARVGLRLRLGRMALSGLSRIIDVEGSLARKPYRNRIEVRAELGVRKDELLIGLGLGGCLDTDFYATIAASAPSSGVRLLSPSPTLERASTSPVECHFPMITPDPQSYYAACDLVLAKAGYSTLAEAAIAGTPLCVFPLRNSPESARLADDVLALGLGLRFPDEELALSALRRPDTLLADAMGVFRGPMDDAAPRLIAALVAEGLLMN